MPFHHYFSVSNAHHMLIGAGNPILCPIRGMTMKVVQRRGERPAHRERRQLRQVDVFPLGAA